MKTCLHDIKIRQREASVEFSHFFTSTTYLNEFHRAARCLSLRNLNAFLSALIRATNDFGKEFKRDEEESRTHVVCFVRQCEMETMGEHIFRYLFTYAFASCDS